MSAQPALAIEVDADLADLEVLAARVQAVLGGPRREAVRRRFLSAVAPILAERETLMTNLGKGMDWFADPANAEHPKYAEREERWSSWLCRYQAIEDALSRCRARGVLAP